MSRTIRYLLLICLIINACVPAFDRSSENVDIALDNEEVKRVFRLQDEQKKDSLLMYLNGNNSTYAYLAALAFSSNPELADLDSLNQLLSHPNLDVRAAAAFSMGQLKKESAEPYLIAAFKNKDTLDINNPLNANILEGIGKTGSQKMLDALATISTYRKTDNFLLLGQARGIYQFALRDMTVQTGTDRMISFVLDTGFPQEVRILAANYLARAKEINIENKKFQLIKFLTSDPDPNIRMAIARAMAKTQDREIHSYLINQLSTEKDYRVLVNIIRSLESHPYIKSVDKVLELLKDKNPHVSLTAAQFLCNAGNPNDASFYKTLINDSLDFRVNGKLYESVSINLPHYFNNTRRKLSEELQQKIKDAKSAQEKVAYIKALGHEPNSFLLLEKIIKEAKDKSVSTTAMEALHQMLKSPLFIKTHKSRHIFKRREIADILLNVLKTGDSGMLAVIGDMIVDPETKLADIMTETSYLIEARNKLELPKQIETYNKLQKAISLLKGETFEAKKLAFNNPIVWNVINEITDTANIVIKTSQGNISFNPFPKLAPGSVANFVKLSESNYYDNKNFHRVVPNFVIQGGCPRGDGYGSLDYSIRTELPPVYYNDEGYVGMARAGLHTEGTQFFITHSPTPHLDGRYTIFGKVNDGMDVVHSILPGDKILDVIITK